MEEVDGTHGQLQLQQLISTVQYLNLMFSSQIRQLHIYFILRVHNPFRILRLGGTISHVEQLVGISRCMWLNEIK